MTVTKDDFNKIWASTSPLTPYSFSESQYKEGWNFIGSTPPSRQMWDFLQKNNDEKMQYLLNHLEALPTTDKVNALIKQAITDLLNSGDVAVNGTQTKIVSDNQISDYSQWNDFKYTAKESGWYSVSCTQPQNGTSSAYIFTGNDNKMSRVNGNGVRTINPGPIWVKAGETIHYGCIYFGECILQVTTREA